MTHFSSLGRLVSCTLIGVTVVLSPLHALTVHAETTPSIMIGEVAWAGSSRSTADEWIELWNVTNEPLSLGGWSLIGAGESGRAIFFPATSTIPAFGTFLISNYRDGDAKSVLATTVDVTTTTVSLSNSTLGIELRAPDGALVDTAGNGKAPAAGSSTPIKASMIRVVPLQDGTLVSAWLAATTSQNMIDTTHFGTPGFCDGCAAFIPPPLQPSVEPIPQIEPIDPVPEPALPIEPVIQIESSVDSPADVTATNTDPIILDLPLESTTDTGAVSVEPPSPQTDEIPILNNENTTPPQPDISPIPETVINQTDPTPVENVSTNSTNQGNSQTSEPEPLTVEPLPEPDIVLLDTGADLPTSETVTSTEPIVDPAASPDPEPSSNETVPITEPTTSFLPEISSGLETQSTTTTSSSLAVSSLTDVLDESVISNDNVSTSTAETADNLQTTSTTTPISVTSTSSTPAATSVQAASSNAPPALPEYGLLRINEFVANPASGKEWIEVVSVDPTQTIPLTDCELHDAVGRIYTFDDVSLTPAVRFVVATLSSSHLNNGGDSVSLYAPDGQLINSFNYDSAIKGEAWIRFPDATGNWVATLTPTEGIGNMLSQPVATTTPMTQSTTTASVLSTTSITASATIPPSLGTTVSTVVTPNITQPPAVSTIQPVVETGTAVVVKTTAAPMTPAPNKKSSAVKVAKPASVPKVKSVATPATKKAPTSTAKKTTTTTSPKAKTPTTKSSTATSSITSLTFDMLTDQETGLRVKLQGTVGSQPGLLTKHGFILLAEDGRGLFVSVPTSRTLPTQGNVVQVTGSLRFNNVNIPYLSVTSKDSWSVLRPASAIAPRTVDLLTPAIEDDWSFVQVTGTVDKVSTTNFHLDLQDASVTISVRPIVGYRTKRLVPGDVVAVSGLLDTSGDEPHLYPRSADEITLVQSAPQKSGTNQNTSSPLSGWAPFGAAGGALALTEGAKQMQRRRQKKLLEKKLSELTTA